MIDTDDLEEFFQKIELLVWDWNTELLPIAVCMQKYNCELDEYWHGADEN